MTKRPKPIFPLPEVLDDGEGWSIVDIPTQLGAVDNKQKILFVPLGDDPHERAVRAHELAHAAISPKDFGKALRRANRRDRPFIKVPEMTVQAVEDTRLHRFLKVANVEDVIVHGPLKRPDKLEHLIALLDDEPSALRQLTYMALSASETGNELAFWKYASNFKDEHRRPIGLIANEIFTSAKASLFRSTNTPTFRQTIKVSREVETLLQHFEQKILAGEKIFSTRKKKIGDSRKWDDHPDKALANYLLAHRRDSTARWGRMTIDEPALERKLPYGRFARRHCPTDEGAVFRSPHRVTTDQQVFGRKRRVPGGTVLIDCSGSMQLEPEDIQNIILAAPEATVAGYSASHFQGTLRIFAKRGMQVLDDLVRPPDNQCNVIDGPALEWLAAQKEPRIWVSDGHVTGVNENQSYELIEDCLRITQAARIKRIPDASIAADTLSKANTSTSWRRYTTAEKENPESLRVPIY